jgi:hypothetical protein
MSRRTIYTGIRELEAMDVDDLRRPSGDARRTRRPGGGRPRITVQQGALAQAVDEILEAHSAGSLDDETVR